MRKEENDLAALAEIIEVATSHLDSPQSEPKQSIIDITDLTAKYLAEGGDLGKLTRLFGNAS